MNSLIYEIPSTPVEEPITDFHDATHTLRYRGTTYQIPQQKKQGATPPRWQELLGKEIIYRGSTYRVGIPKTPEKLPTQQQVRLIYRGETYLKSVDRSELID